MVKKLDTNLLIVNTSDRHDLPMFQIHEGKQWHYGNRELKEGSFGIQLRQYNLGNKMREGLRTKKCYTKLRARKKMQEANPESKHIWYKSSSEVKQPSLSPLLCFLSIWTPLPDWQSIASNPDNWEVLWRSQDSGDKQWICTGEASAACHSTIERKFTSENEYITVINQIINS